MGFFPKTPRCAGMRREQHCFIWANVAQIAAVGDKLLARHHAEGGGVRLAGGLGFQSR